MTTKEVITQLRSLVSEAEYRLEKADELEKEDPEYVFLKDKVALEYAIALIKKNEARKTVKDPISLTIITDAFEFLAKQDMPSAWTPTETKAIYQFLMELQERRKE